MYFLNQGAQSRSPTERALQVKVIYTRANDLAEAIHRYVELCSSIYPKVLDHIATSCDTYWRCAS